MGKLLGWIVWPPLALILIALAIANRHVVTLSLDPFDPQKPALGLDLPLSAIVFFALFAGILIGGFASWTQARRKLRRRLTPFPGSTNLPASRVDS
jgi:uncharacterized integral membrane protein